MAGTPDALHRAVKSGLRTSIYRFYTCDAMLARVLAMALCLFAVCVLSKWLNESGWAWELHSTYPTLCYKEILVTSK